MLDIDSRLAPVSSIELACSDAPLATNWLVEAIWAEAEETWSTACATCASASCSACAVAFSASVILA